jgi:N-methylhydantoinase B/oxoprolinase/acetone carboxylase alpha subunit
LGSRYTIQNIGQTPLTYSVQVGRLRHPPLGLLGGSPGSPNRLFFNGSPEGRGWGRWELQPGDRFTRESSGGGGLYSPLLREPHRVLDDVSEGYVSKRNAEEVYGLIIEGSAIQGQTEARLVAQRLHDDSAHHGSSVVTEGTFPSDSQKQAQ